MACLSLPALLLARITGKRSVIFVWDDYSQPVGQNRFVAVLERAALALCDQVLIPSPDYQAIQASKAAGKVSVFPLWPVSRVCPAKPRTISDGDVCRVVFAGQINSVRGLDATLGKLSAMAGLRLQMHIFSGDGLPDTVAGSGSLDIIEHGFIPPEVLDERLPKFDFGLVSLDRNVAAPAFPSKILSYFCAGLPVLYHGPELAAVTGLLQGRGLGVVLRGQDNAALGDELARVRDTFPDARTDYLRQCELSWDRLADVL